MKKGSTCSPGDRCDRLQRRRGLTRDVQVLADLGLTYLRDHGNHGSIGLASHRRSPCSPEGHERPDGAAFETRHVAAIKIDAWDSCDRRGGSWQPSAERFDTDRVGSSIGVVLGWGSPRRRWTRDDAAAFIPTCDPCNTGRPEAAALLDLDIATTRVARCRAGEGSARARTAGRPAQRGAYGRPGGDRSAGLQTSRPAKIRSPGSAQRAAGPDARWHLRLRGAGLRVSLSEACQQAKRYVVQMLQWRYEHPAPVTARAYLTTQHSLDACGSHAFDGPGRCQASGMVDLNLHTDDRIFRVCSL